LLADSFFVPVLLMEVKHPDITDIFLLGSCGWKMVWNG